jgi:hypothetical protein
VVHWADGGATALDNLVLLCRRHHRLLHEGQYTARSGVDGAMSFVRPNGLVVEVAPAPPRWERGKAEGVEDVGRASMEPTLNRLAAAGIEIGPHTAPCWDGTPFNVGYVIDALRGNEPLPPRTHADQASKTFSTSSP